MKKQLDQPYARHIDLKVLTFSAKIDYISIHTPGKLKLPALSGKAVWPKKHHGNRLTVHDASPADIDALISTFGSSRIIELEIAIDVKPRKIVPIDECEHLLQSVMVDLFARGLEPSSGVAMKNEFRAFYRRLGAGYFVCPFNKRLPIATDQQLHGGRGDAVQVKGYWKRRDQNVNLTPKKQVARVEVRLGAQGLCEHNLTTLASLKEFRFRKFLMPYFTHVQGTTRHPRGKCDSSKPMLTILRNKLHEFDQKHWSRVGAGAFVRGGIQHHSRVRLVRNTKVNNRIGQALTRLEQQFRKAKSVRFVETDPGGNPLVASLFGHNRKSCMTN